MYTCIPAKRLGASAPCRPASVHVFVFLLFYLCDETPGAEEVRCGVPDVRGEGGAVTRADGVEKHHHPVVLARPLEGLEVVVGQPRPARDDDEGVVLCLGEVFVNAARWRAAEQTVNGGAERKQKVRTNMGRSGAERVVDGVCEAKSASSEKQTSFCAAIKGDMLPLVRGTEIGFRVLVLFCSVPHGRTQSNTERHRLRTFRRQR